MEIEEKLINGRIETGTIEDGSAMGYDGDVLKILDSVSGNFTTCHNITLEDWKSAKSIYE